MAEVNQNPCLSPKTGISNTLIGNWDITMLPYIQKPFPDILDTAQNS